MQHTRRFCCLGSMAVAAALALTHPVDHAATSSHAWCPKISVTAMSIVVHANDGTVQATERLRIRIACAISRTDFAPTARTVCMQERHRAAPQQPERACARRRSNLRTPPPAHTSSRRTGSVAPMTPRLQFRQQRAWWGTSRILTSSCLALDLYGRSRRRLPLWQLRRVAAQSLAACTNIVNGDAAHCRKARCSNQALRSTHVQGMQC